MRDQCGAQTRAMPLAQGRWKEPLPDARWRGRQRRTHGQEAATINADLLAFIKD